MDIRRSNNTANETRKKRFYEFVNECSPQYQADLFKHMQAAGYDISDPDAGVLISLLMVSDRLIIKAETIKSNVLEDLEPIAKGIARNAVQQEIRRDIEELKETIPIMLKEHLKNAAPAMGGDKYKTGILIGRIEAFTTYILTIFAIIGVLAAHHYWPLFK